MAKREFLQLAHVYKDEPISGWFMSEKLDGQRAFYDGGITRGTPVKDVPFANHEKDARYITQPVATGLWSRYGKTIQAPNWWLDMLPKMPLDGELYIERNSFQQLISATKHMVPGPEWKRVKYVVFDSPPLNIVLGDGEMDNINFKKRFLRILDKLRYEPMICPTDYRFSNVNTFLRSMSENEVFKVHGQYELAHTFAKAREEIAISLNATAAGGGEGLMLRHPVSFWSPQRSRQLLKVKPVNDDEGVVIGYVAGRETDKGSKLLGLMGALILSYKGKVFELSGFTEAERRLNEAGTNFAVSNPGKKLPEGMECLAFPLGSSVTFKYRELTDDGLPKEARYWRKA